MNRQKKILLSIVAVFALTIGLLSVQFGFANKNDELAIGDSSEQTMQHQENEKNAEQDPIEAAEQSDVQDLAEANQENEENKLDEPEEEQANKEESTSSDSVKETAPTPTEQSKENNSNVAKTQTGTANTNTKNTKETTKAKEKTSKASKPTEKSKQENKEKPTQKPKETPKEKPKETPAEKPPEKPPATTVTYSIVADKEMGTILAPISVEITEGDTVLDVLIKATREQGIPMSFRGGTGASAYVEGINNLFEFDRGQGSGWMYRVNGIFPNRGAGVIPLLHGDRIEWLYTLDLGKDLGAELKPFR